MLSEPHHFRKTITRQNAGPKQNPGIPVDLAKRYLVAYLQDGQASMLSKNTLSNRRSFCGKLLKFMDEREYSVLSSETIRQFFAHLASGHLQPGGRWGNNDTRKDLNEPPRPNTVRTYYRYIHAFVEYMIDNDVAPISPMARIKPPADTKDQVQPFTAEQVEALLLACRRHSNAERNKAMILFMLDTGVRVSELCSIKKGDMDVVARTAWVTGKGNKRRQVYYCSETNKAIFAYLRSDLRHVSDKGQDPNRPLFLSNGSKSSGDALRRSGVRKVFTTLKDIADVVGVRCSPHTFRHTFAISFLRAGGNTFTLQQLLGHTSMTMTSRYVKLANADMQMQHRAFSPVEFRKKVAKQMAIVEGHY